MNKLLLVLLAAALVACSNDVQISSDSTKFMGETLGKAVSSNGELNYDEDRGCYLKTKNGAIAECLLKTKEVFKIFVNCAEVQGSPSISGIKCGDVINNSHFDKFKKICSESNFEDGFYINQKNAYIWVGKNMKVEMLALAKSIEDIRGEGEESYSQNACSEIENRKNEDLSKWRKNKNWNFLIDSCTTTNDQDIDECNPTRAALRDVMVTTFEIWDESSSTSYAIFGQEQRRLISPKYWQSDMMNTVSVKYEKLDKPNHLKVRFAGGDGDCHHVWEFSLENNVLFQTDLEQFGNCSELLQLMFKENKGKKVAKRIIFYR